MKLDTLSVSITSMCTARWDDERIGTVYRPDCAMRPPTLRGPQLSTTGCSFCDVALFWNVCLTLNVAEIH